MRNHLRHRSIDTTECRYDHSTEVCDGGDWGSVTLYREHVPRPRFLPIHIIVESSSNNGGRPIARYPYRLTELVVAVAVSGCEFRYCGGISAVVAVPGSPVPSESLSSSEPHPRTCVTPAVHSSTGDNCRRWSSVHLLLYVE